MRHAKCNSILKKYGIPYQSTGVTENPYLLHKKQPIKYARVSKTGCLKKKFPSQEKQTNAAIKRQKIVVYNGRRMSTRQLLFVRLECSC